MVASNITGEDLSEEPISDLKRVSGQCPYCNAKAELPSKDFIVKYMCGSYASTLAGEYAQNCCTPIITTHWGPL